MYHRDNWPVDNTARTVAPGPVPAIPLALEGVEAALAQVFERVGELERRLAPVLRSQLQAVDGSSGNPNAPRPSPPLASALHKLAERLSELDIHVARLTERLEL